jgi:hypothetical protein
LLTSLSSSITGGMSFSSYKALLQSVWREAYDSKKCTYVGHCVRSVTALDMTEASVHGLFGGIRGARPAARSYMRYPDYTSTGINGYNGLVPSSNILRQFFVKHVRFSFPTSDSVSENCVHYIHYNSCLN